MRGERVSYRVLECGVQRAAKSAIYQGERQGKRDELHRPVLGLGRWHCV